MISDLNRKPCILENSEEQECWHINTGGSEVCSNGYEPLAMGSYERVLNLKDLVGARLGDKTKLSEVREVLWDTLWQYANVLPDVRYVVPSKTLEK